MFDRADVLGLPGFRQLGRLYEPCYYTQKEMKSKATGTQINKNIVISGRVIIDAYTYATRNEKLRSYRLNAVSAHFLSGLSKVKGFGFALPPYKPPAFSRLRTVSFCL